MGGTEGGDTVSGALGSVDNGEATNEALEGVVGRAGPEEKGLSGREKEEREERGTSGKSLRAPYMEEKESASAAACAEEKE